MEDNISKWHGLNGKFLMDTRTPNPHLAVLRNAQKQTKTIVLTGIGRAVLRCPVSFTAR